MTDDRMVQSFGEGRLRRGFRLLLLLTFAAGIPAGAAAFSGSDMDALLEMDALTRGAASRLVAEAARSAGAAAGAAAKFETPAEDSGEEPVSLGTYSHMLMEAFDISGGIMYSLFPSGRYASRELGFRGYIRGDSGAYRTVSGQEALGILGRVLQGEAGE